MSLRTLILFSPFVLAVLLGRAASIPDHLEKTVNETGPMHDFSMQRYEWRNRPLLVFSPSQMDKTYLETMIVWNRNGPKLDERDLILIEIFEDGTGRAEGREIPESSVATLIERYEPTPGTVTILLVGKDGSEKRRWDQLPPLQQIYDLIDAMPMRQREIQSQRPGTSG